MVALAVPGLGGLVRSELRSLDGVTVGQYGNDGRADLVLGCRDLRRQTLHPTSAKLVIRAEFALAQVPELRELVEKLTLNRAGRSVYYGLVEECKGRPGSYKPAKAAITGVLAGKYRAARNRPG